MSSLDDYTQPVEDDQDDCDCDDLPNGVPCFDCYLDGDADFQRGESA